MSDERLPGETRRNWRPGDDDAEAAVEAARREEERTKQLEAYIEQCERDGKSPTLRELAKLLGVSVKSLEDTKLLADFPGEFVDIIIDSYGELFRQLPRLARHLKTGAWSHVVEREHCPHCGEVVRERWRVSKKLIELWNGWLEQRR
jgi:formate dehydrogenase maturation protein FdhE